VPSPNPRSFTNALNLYGVSAISGSEAWAVGDYVVYKKLVPHTLILHWNGTAWSREASPSPGSAIDNLSGVNAVSGSDAWAVGDHQFVRNTHLVEDTLILRWNGTVWTKT
jgi:hypothetical protein